MTFYDGNKKISLISLAIPLLLQQIFNTLCGTASIMLLSGYSETAVSAASVANQIFSLNSALILMVITGTTILTSIEIGSKNLGAASSYTGTGAVSTVLVGCVLAIINFVFAEPLLFAMNLRGETLTLACEYLKIRSLFLPIYGLLTFFNHLLICNGFSKDTFAAGALTNVFNIILSFVALYADLNFMTPLSRISLAYGLAQICGLAFASIVFKYKKCPWRFNFGVARFCKILKIGIPGNMAIFVFILAQTITTGFVAAMGDTAINTKAYIGNIITYVPLVGWSLANANQVLLGRFRGSGELEKSNTSHKQNCLLAVLCNIFFSLTVFALHRPLMMMFTSNQSIINASSIIFFVDLFVQIPRAINNVSEGSLCANGDTKITFIISTIACIIGSIALSYLLCVVLCWGLIGLWIAFVIDESIKAIIYILRWRSGKWKYIKI
jgi:putative MATE family efflux protein